MKQRWLLAFGLGVLLLGIVLGSHLLTKETTLFVAHPVKLDTADSAAVAADLNPPGEPAAVPQADSAASALSAPTMALSEADPGSALSALKSQINAERSARRRLQQQLDRLQDNLLDVELRLRELAANADTDSEDANNRQSNAQRPAISVSTLIEAGFNPDQAALIAQRWSQHEMDRLYLRDQALREGWIDSAQYRESARALRAGFDSIWDDFDDTAYDRFLYANGRPNRVQVESVIDSSPAQSLGLQTGDIIMSYAGDTVYSGEDLRQAITTGTADEPVSMQVLRGDEVVEYQLPRGPLGVMLNGISVAPPPG